ncbi:energy transducer TonB [Pedobacter rhizosphaerae]|uniref:Outer membrane transport energization protein TonB n=1 Tax=Pedobacter rhizosphaerae TaxID=390241 RepID=A0A1H9VJ52_9SPHI|nr:energy transducer TonB [Pedobacter rhizosphaerae]SES21253.1 outer membrane transport energization protein TonB [Pedobacter rhizosphaerae]
MFNSSINVYKTEWLDLVFADRNKNYGAYELRSKSSRIMTRSLLITGSLFVLLCFSPLIYSKIFPKEVIIEDHVITEITTPDQIHDLKKNEPEEKKEPAKADPVKVKTVKMVANIVVVDKEEVEAPPTIADIKDAVVSNKTQEGEIKPDLVLNNANTAGDGNGLGKDADTGGDGNVILDPSGVDVYPEFEGGMKAWAKYIQRNLRYPSMAQENDVSGKVFLSFVVEKDGSITDVKVLKGIGYGCDEEAVKVIKKSPLWKAGMNKGIPVRVRYNMPISFTMM